MLDTASPQDSAQHRLATVAMKAAPRQLILDSVVPLALKRQALDSASRRTPPRSRMSIPDPMESKVLAVCLEGLPWKDKPWRGRARVSDV
mmetsp:Transcript_36535/g.97331  ORF Transcript_36535/g.97331 Transcript_36535/m.97331 type:complete len:90 (-) Transcript_36535:478-747(-)